MNFSINYNGSVPARDSVLRDIVSELESHGHGVVPLSGELKFILNMTTLENPNTVHRKTPDEFVVSLMALPGKMENQRSACYNTLVSTLSNLLMCVVPNGGQQPEIWCTTPEAGYFHFPYTPGNMYERMLPVISARMMIGNRLTENLPDNRRRTEITDKLRYYGGVLDALGFLPAPFPLGNVLSPENLDHLYRLFKVKGLSYGNLSAREQVPEIGPDTFWMTARGVDKAHLVGPGDDMLLVTGFNPVTGEILASVPAGYNPKVRVSVDAIEHTLIYQAFPCVGAILHVHCWMKEIPCTSQNFPCGTLELAREVVSLLRTAEHPEKAVVGLINHGITVTGPDLDEIFSRIEGKLCTEVPMI
jgi:ribulose-5-phosphate 4-epimerase/fuculose-1-phosphate aldolase